MSKSQPLSPVYILHGWTHDVEAWQPLTKILKKHHFQPIVLNIPGLSAPLDQTWNLDDYVAWFKTAIKGQQDLFIIAHSFGGRIALRFEVQNPNRVKKLILIDSSGIKPSSVAARLKRFSFRAAAKIGKKITQNRGARHLLYRLAREQDYLKTDGVLRHTMANIVQENQLSEIDFVKAHTLIIWGRGDKTTPLSNGRYFNKHITGSTLKIIDDARHSPQYTHPDLVASYICDFLGVTNKS